MKGVTLKTYDGRLLDLSEERLVLEENRNYQIILSGEAIGAELFWGDVPVLVDANGIAPIVTGHWVGDTAVRVVGLAGTMSVPVRVQPRSEKLSDMLWVAMLQDLEAWVPGMTVGSEGGRGGQVGTSGASVPLLAEALTPLIGAFTRAVRALVEQPKLLDVTVVEEVSLHKAQRVDSETLNWISRHPDLHPYLDPWKSMDLPQCQPILQQRRTVDTIDHPVNRYICWLALRVEKTLRDAADRLETQASVNVFDETIWWLRARSKAMRAGADRLFRLRKTSVLSSITPVPLSEGALQVVLDEPLYARVHKMGRLFLNPLFQLNSDSESHQASVKPSFSIYELWCFLHIGEQLKKLRPTWKWSTIGAGKLLGYSSTGEGALHRAVSPSGTELVVAFNPTFSGYFSRSNRKRWSISAERRPDIVVSLKPLGGEGRWLCLDAKYRVGQRNLADAFSSVHIYRDALRYDGYGGGCMASVLLAPSKSPEVEEWFSERFLEKHQEGIFELQPGGFDCKLGAWIIKVLSTEGSET